MAKIVIIGAGLTGLSTAYHLEQQGFFDYALFEQETEIGGLCRSIRNDGFTFDYTGHFFHCNSASTMQLLHNIMSQSTLTNHTRRSYVYSHDTYTPYPYQTNLYGLPPHIIIDCITGFVERKKRKDNGKFSTWVNNYFGSGFAQHFFFPYQEKIFDYPVNKLRTGWVSSVPQTTLTDILQGALSERNIHSIGYNANFWYPKIGGIDNLIHAFGNALKNNLYKNCCAIHIDTIKSVVTFSNGHSEPYEYLVSTMPLTNCLNLINMDSEAKKLLYNSVININLGINRPELSLKHWVYYPEKKYPFFRIGFPHTLGSMAPEGCSSLSIEIATRKNQTPSHINNISKQAVDHVKKLFNISQKDIITEQILLLPHAYVTYDLWREKNINALLKDLETKSIYSVGRYGAWKYTSMYDAIIDGQSIAHQLANHITSMYQPARIDRKTIETILPEKQNPLRRSIKEIL